MKSSIYTLEPVNWQIKAQLLNYSQEICLNRIKRDANVEEIRRFVKLNPDLLNMNGIPKGCGWVTSPLSHLGNDILMTL